MSTHTNGKSRRAFLAAAAGAAISAVVPSQQGLAVKSTIRKLQVWSCGGLAEAFLPANNHYRKKTGVDISYTGAYAGALGKSLLGGASTEVFAGRVLALAKQLRQAQKMVYFKPLCFTRYVLVTPKGNPAGIKDIKDLTRPGVRIILTPNASPPGGKAISILLKKAGVLERTMKNTVIQGSCVQQTMKVIADGRADASVVEYRLTRMPAFKDNSEVINIPARYFPSPPLTFTIGVMQHAADKTLADRYVDFILSEEGQHFFESAGFIPARSAKGQRLVDILGVKDG